MQTYKAIPIRYPMLKNRISDPSLSTIYSCKISLVTCVCKQERLQIAKILQPDKKKYAESKDLISIYLMKVTFIKNLRHFAVQHK